MSETLLTHIQSTLPGVVRRVDELTKRALERQEQLGAAVDAAGREALLVQVLREVSEKVARVLEGEDLHVLRSDAPPATQVVGGARIERIVHAGFVPAVRDLRAEPLLTDERMRTTTLNCTGRSLVVSSPGPRRPPSARAAGARGPSTTRSRATGRTSRARSAAAGTRGRRASTCSSTARRGSSVSPTGRAACCRPTTGARAWPR